VRGYKEEGTTTTPFDMCVLNNIDRFQLNARRHPPRCPGLHRDRRAQQWYSEQIQRHKLYVSENGDDLRRLRIGVGGRNRELAELAVLRVENLRRWTNSANSAKPLTPST